MVRGEGSKLRLYRQARPFASSPYRYTPLMHESWGALFLMSKVTL